MIQYCVKSDLGDDAGGSKRYGPSSTLAYASAVGNCALRDSLVWRFWEPAIGEFVPDPRLSVTVNNTFSDQTHKKLKDNTFSGQTPELKKD